MCDSDNFFISILRTKRVSKTTRKIYSLNLSAKHTIKNITHPDSDELLVR